MTNRLTDKEGNDVVVVDGMLQINPACNVRAVLDLEAEETKELIKAIAIEVKKCIPSCNGCSKYEMEDMLTKENSAIRALGIGLGKGLGEKY